MTKRLRDINLSLATKCQLLFGVASGVIILAALMVTWQRIEQLTAQQDLVAAEVLARQTLAEHVVSGAVSGSAEVQRYGGAVVRRPRLVGADGAARGSRSPFEQAALDRFRDRPEARFHVRSAELPGIDDGPGRPGTRLAMAVRNAADCRSCHLTPTSSLDLAPGPATTRPATLAAEGELLGLVSVEIPTQVSERQQLLNRVFLITAALAAAATATLTLYIILTRLILTPVRVLQDTAERVRGGDLNVRADIRSGDEFEALSQTFNAMVAGLQQRNQQLAQANRSLDQKLGDLGEANVALDESNRLKGEFLANVSHELRTPLNSILGFADLVRSAGGDNPKVDRYANNIKTSGQSLLELINDLLDLAKIEAGRMEVRRGELSLKDLFEALATLLAPLAAKQQVRVVAEVSPEVPILSTDAGKLRQVLYNLLSNAIKFSPRQGRVDLVARLRERGSDSEGTTRVRITVTDQGPGIAEADRERIFEKFRQLDSGVTREFTGTGLGLSISRELVGLLEGEIGVDSTPGQGATFWIHLPVKPGG
jgi:signal transduction histidine kinase